MNNRTTFFVSGMPAPQGSKRGFPVKRKNGTVGVAITESAGERVKTWRQDVRETALQVMEDVGWETVPRHQGVRVDITFWFPRPKSHYGTGANVSRMKPSAPRHHLVKPDKDKLERAVLDALTSAGVYVDDSQVVVGTTEKLWGGDLSGATITITNLDV